MNQQAKWLGLILALGMFVFSAWMYLQSGDWVAAVFALGSVGYALYFFGSRDRSGASERPGGRL
jgi:hypothetical protein